MCGSRVILSFALLWGGVRTACADEVPRMPLVAVRSLTPAEANQKTEVRASGTVTFIDHKSLSVFFQDGTAGAYFRPTRIGALQPGDAVEVRGKTQRGYYVPGIAQATFEIVRRGTLPTPAEARYADLVSARFHYQWVAVEGIARAHSRLKDGRGLMRIAMDGHTLEIRSETNAPASHIPIGSVVRVEGLGSGTLTPRRQLLMPYIRVSDWASVRVLRTSDEEEELQRVSAAELLTFRIAGFATGRVQVGGVVTAAFPGGIVFARDEKTGFGIQFVDAPDLAVGDWIEVRGFPQVDRLSAHIADAVLVEHCNADNPSPVELSPDKLMGGLFDSDLVTISGQVTDTYRVDDVSVLTFRNENRAIRARLPSAMQAPPDGAWVRITGICEVESSREHGYLRLPSLVALRTRTEDDVVIVHAPSWWTAERLFYALATLAVLTVLALLWITFLRRQVAVKTRALAKKIESEAALQERQRIARDFHDTLEQDLAGLRLQLDAIASDRLGRAQQGLVAASQKLVKRIQLETRALITDLRDTAGAGTTLGSSLQECIARLSPLSSAEVRLALPERMPSLPATTIRHLRLIAGEGLANALKHSGARTVRVSLILDNRRLVLRVADDGCGFDAARETRGRLGHFGCIGIRERCRKIGAIPDWTSEEGLGTTLTIALPLGNDPTSVGSHPPDN